MVPPQVRVQMAHREYREIRELAVRRARGEHQALVIPRGHRALAEFQIHRVHRVVVVRRVLAERLARMVLPPFQIVRVLREQMLNRVPRGQAVLMVVAEHLHPQMQPRVQVASRVQVEATEVRGQAELRVLVVV